MGLSSLGDAFKGVKVVNGSGANKKAKRLEKKGVGVAVAAQSPVAARPKFSFSELKVRAPQLPDPRSRRFVPSKEEVQAARQEALALQEELTTFCGKIGPIMHDLLGQVWEVIQAPDEDQLFYAEGKEELKAEIMRILNSAEDFRVPGLIAYADAVIRTAPRPDQMRDVMAVVAELLIVEGFLVLGSGVGIRHENRNYVLPKNLYAREDAHLVLRRFQELRGRVVQAQKAEARSEFENLQAIASEKPVTWEQLLNGAEGYLILEVPDKVEGDKTFRGGFVLIAASGGEVRLVDGVGSMHRYVAGFNADSAVKVEQLLEVNPTFKGLDRRDQKGIHSLIRRYIDGQNQQTAPKSGEVTTPSVATASVSKPGLTREDRKAKFKAECDAEYDELKKGETVSFDQFFEGGVGKFVLRMSQFKNKNTGAQAWYPMALIERLEDGRVALRTVPERPSLKEFFKGVGVEPVQPGEKYSRLVEPLRGMLQASSVGYEKRKAATAEVRENLGVNVDGSVIEPVAAAEVAPTPVQAVKATAKKTTAGAKKSSRAKKAVVIATPSADAAAAS